MSTITENPRITDVVFYEGDGVFNYQRDAITVLSGALACMIGQVMGQTTLGAATSAAKAGGNTGTGTLTLDVTTPVLANAKAGIYQVRVLAVGTAVVTDPKGVIVGEFTYTAGGTTTFADQVKFAFADNVSTHYVAGDGFDVTIAAGSGKWNQVAPSATDGTQNAAGVLVAGSFTATLTADTPAVAVTRGPAILKLNGLAWTSGMTSGQIATAIAQLQALGMTTRTDYGA